MKRIFALTEGILNTVISEGSSIHEKEAGSRVAHVIVELPSTSR